MEFNHHYFCSSYFYNDDEILSKLSNEVNYDYLLLLLTKSFKKIKKNKENQKNEKNELILNRKLFLPLIHLRMKLLFNYQEFPKKI